MSNARTKINLDYCKGCNLCVTICPVKVYEEGDTVSPKGYIVPKIIDAEKCIDYKRSPDEEKRCELCILVCPDQAISWGNE